MSRLSSKYPGMVGHWPESFSELNDTRRENLTSHLGIFFDEAENWTYSSGTGPHVYFTKWGTVREIRFQWKGPPAALAKKLKAKYGDPGPGSTCRWKPDQGRYSIEMYPCKASNEEAIIQLRMKENNPEPPAGYIEKQKRVEAESKEELDGAF